jgi:hypothetical protein
MADPTRPSPLTATAIALLFGVVGIVVIVAALRTVGRPDGDPRWLAVAAGVIFVLAGAAVYIGFAVAGGATPDGDLPPDTPFVLRVIQYLLGLGIAGLMTAIFGWIAFGPGTRSFRITGLGLLGLADGERAGRIAFGVGTVVMGLFLILLATIGARRLLRARQP